MRQWKSQCEDEVLEGPASGKEAVYFVYSGYRGTSLIRKRPPPKNHDEVPGMVLISEVSLHNVQRALEIQGTHRPWIGPELLGIALL